MYSRHSRHGSPTIGTRTIASLLLLIASACSGGTSSDQVVHVTLTDSPSEQAVESDVTTFQAGVAYHFIVDNTGSLAHELMIVEPIEPGMMDMEQMDEMAMYVVEEDDLEPGSTVEFDYTFTDDEVGMPLEFACHIAGHYELGMHESITVEG